MKPRKTLQQMASQEQPRLTIAGKPADVCPYCGCGMFKNRVQRLASRVERYVYCRNANCGKKFLSSQPAETLVREIGADEEDEISSGGIEPLTLKVGTA